MDKLSIVTVYAEDAQWLEDKQRQVSFRKGQHVTMFDLLHEIINRVRKEEEAEYDG